METLEATFKVVTPMFISGAEQDKVELRVPSIKGALRFWWRALAWGRYSDISEIKEAESKLFGSTTNGQAAVLLQLKTHKFNIQTQRKWRPSSWEGYGGYGLIETSGSDSREYVVPGQIFCLILRIKNGIEKQELISLQNALVTLGLFGGIGGRSRKGWGSITLIEMKNFDIGWDIPQDLTQFKRTAKKILNHENHKDNLSSYTAISNGSNIALGPLKDNCEDAHRYLVEHYRESVKKTHPKADRDQFGTPRGKNNQRRASPLFLHVHQFPNNSALPMALYLPAEYLPDKPNIPGNGNSAKEFMPLIDGES